MNRARRPNLFIVGAPKCGTTSLYRYLSQHPDVFMSKGKEPCFFGSDFDSPMYPKRLAAYLALFADAEGQTVVGEATTTYLYSKRAAEEIKQFSPEAKIIILLRNPPDMVYSLHAQRVFEGTEAITDFEQALNAEDDRRKGRRLPKGLLFPREYFLYRDTALFTEQINRYVDAFSWERIHVTLFRDFEKDTSAEFTRICEFLGISASVDVVFSVHNANTVWRSRSLLRLALSRPGTVVRKMWPERLKRALRPLLTVEKPRPPRPPMPPAVRKELNAFFAPEVRRLSRFLSRDLAHWCREG